MNLMAGSLGGRFPAAADARLEIVSVLINNACNLRCRHCYLQARVHDPLRAHEWLQFFGSLFADLAPSVLCFAGKEPFLDAGSVDLWQRTIHLRDRVQRTNGRRTAIGVITNGTLVLQHQAPLRRTPPDYIDVSVDGLPAFHDHVRGVGAFGALEPNLHWLASEFGDRLWITHTLFDGNIQELPRFVQFLNHGFGIQRFSLGFYRQLPYTDSALALHPAPDLLGAVRQLQQVRVESPIEMVMDVAWDQLAALDGLQDLGWLPSTEAISSEPLRLRNGITLRINSSRVPTGLWRAVRVSADGHWLAAEDLVEPRRYGERAVANLRHCRFDARAAYQAGLSHPVFEELTRGTTLQAELRHRAPVDALA